jgi:hypothetical protein
VSRNGIGRVHHLGGFRLGPMASMGISDLPPLGGAGSSVLFKVMTSVFA